MADINSAVQAALDAGVDKLIVCDTHHGGGNIRLGEMLSDPRITYLQKSRGIQDGKLRWLPGLDETVDGFMVPGHHARAGTAGAFLPHTWMLDWADFRINGQSVGEMGIEACFAGHWGIPVIFAQGDETACREAEGMFPGIVTACVKRATSPDTCESSLGVPPLGGLPYVVPPLGGLGTPFSVLGDAAWARRLTAEKVAQAIHKLRAGGCQSFRPALPMAVAIRMATAQKAEAAARRPGVERVDGDTVQCRVERHCDVVKWIVDTGLDVEVPKTSR
jgi:D-aminopeptidase